MNENKLKKRAALEDRSKFLWRPESNNLSHGQRCYCIHILESSEDKFNSIFLISAAEKSRKNCQLSKLGSGKFPQGEEFMTKT